MRFITEDDLRELYKSQSFSEYQLETGTRITPGARQFLLDRGIRILDGTEDMTYGTMRSDGVRVEKECCPSNDKGARTERLLSCKLKNVEARMLCTAQALLTTDMVMAGQVVELGRHLANIRQLVTDKLEQPVAPDILCKYCTGITQENIATYLDDCFSITDKHIALPKGKEIVLLNELRWVLREVALELEPVLTQEDPFKDTMDRMNRIINTISQMVCSCVGGDRCQKE